MERVKVGDCWGRMRCTAVGQLERVQEYEGGGSDKTYPKAYTLECECGKTTEVLASEFLGKRATKDCGCGASKDDGVVVTMVITVPLDVRRRVHRFASENTNGNMSAAVAALVRKGTAEVVESTWAESEVNSAKR